MRRRGDLALVAALLPLLAAASYFVVAQTKIDAELTPRRTTFSPLPGGYKAAYLLLERRGIPVARLQSSTEEWPKDAALIVTSSPYTWFRTDTEWKQDDAKKAKQWVESGGHLLLLQDADNELTRVFGITIKNISSPNATLPPAQPAAFLRAITGVKFPQEARFTKMPSSSVTLFGDKKPALAAGTLGKGAIFATTSPGIFENHTLSDADNARLLTQFAENARAAHPGKIYFDEYRQGFGEARTFLSIIGSAGRFTLLQLILVAVLLCYTAGKRFGIARPAPPASRVSSEYVASLADLYRRAGASDAALEGVYLSFWRDLCRAAGVPIDADDADVIQRAAALLDGSEKQREIFRSRLSALINECETRIPDGPKSVPNDQLLRLTRDMESLRKDLRLGATN